MSKETSAWLNTMTLIGNVLARGKAWHYRAENQGTETNHYDGFIPVEDVERRLFNFTVLERTPRINVAEDGEMEEWIELLDRKVMIASDDKAVLGVFKDSYKGHDYKEWLLGTVAHILGDDINISSAGLLRNRAQAWVEVSIPDSIETPEGVVFRPNLLAYTSFDGSLATGFKRTFQNTVCDNTMFAAIASEGELFKARHSKNSGFKLQKAKDALAIVHTASDEFAAEVKRLCEVSVTDSQWSKIVDQIVPIPTGDNESKRGVTVAENKREKLSNLWNFDGRVAPWTNTGWGVLQAFNTYHHHMSTVKGDVHRGTRNMDDALSGRTAKGDKLVLDAMELVLSN
jgi:phage/plasmid-like protein (TIGR03299 family)